MDIKEIALRIGEEADEYADAKLQSKGEFHPDWHTVRDEYFAEALIESYKSELLKEVGEPVAHMIEYKGKCMGFLPTKEQGTIPVFTSDQVAAAVVKATKPLEEEITRRVTVDEMNAEIDSASKAVAEHYEEKLAKEEQRIAELEAEDERLKVENRDSCVGLNDYYGKQLAASQLSETQLREALQTYIDEHEECQDADDWMAMMCSMEAHHAADKALSQPSDTSSLVSFVAEEVKELDEANEYHRQLARVSRDNELKATKQRDLAVEALEDVRKELQQSNDRLNEEREIWDRVMGDGVKKLERLELELDDCLYVLESLWDKTCNKEVTEKWAGILIRNKRGIGASSAEDSSEQTTA